MIVSAGVIETPKLLMLSGIGDKEQLSKFNIPLVEHLPAVGKSLQSHLRLVLNYDIGGHNPLSNLTYDDVRQLKQDRKGPLSKQSSIYFGNLNIAPFSKGANDTRFGLLFYLYPIGYKLGLGVTHINYVPKSFGTVSLRSKDPFDHPAIDPNYFADPEDKVLLKKGIRIGLDFITKSTALKDLKLTLQPVSSDCGTSTIEALYNDRFLDCYLETVQNRPATPHLSSTCRMGNGKDRERTVVDFNLKIIGIENVRVIDSSVMPSIVRGATNGPVTMIAAKGVSMILDSLAKNQ